MTTALIKRLKKSSGRNSTGKITMRHQGGGHKQMYRLIDFKQDKFDITGRIESVEYDPCRSSLIAKVVYKDGERRYILASSEMKAGDEIVTSVNVPLKLGNRTQLKRIPVGTFVYNVELFPGKGGQLARSAGLAVQVLANEEGYTHLKLASGEIRKVIWDGYASIGRVSHLEHNLEVSGKAGHSRWLGIRPTVRGTVMNPCDHPYGGGEGKQPRGTKRPKTKWGKVTGGHKTRNKKKWSSKLIIKRREHKH